MHRSCQPISEQPGEPSNLRSDAFLKQAMERWGDSVYRVALVHTSSPTDAEDIYQDVFLRLLKDTTAFVNDEHLKAWLLRVTINRCHDLARSSWKRRTDALEDTYTEVAAPDEFRADIWELVSALPEDLRAVVHLFYVEGYSTNEIASIVQCQPGTVRSRLSRAREQLRDTLQADDESRKESTHDRASQKTFARRLPRDDVQNTCTHPSQA